MHVPKLRRNGDGRAFAVYPKSKGLRCYFGRYGDPQVDVAYRQWLTKVLQGHQPVLRGDEMLVADLIEKYLDHCEEELGKQTQAFNLVAQTVARLVVLAGDRPAIQLGPRMMQDFYNQMASETYQRSETKEPAHYTRTYISKCLRQVVRMTRWACAQELLPPDHWTGLQAFQMPRKRSGGVREGTRVQPVDWCVVRATQGFLHEPVRTMVQVQFVCGMRPQDVCNMRPKDVERTPGVWLYVPYEHKNTHRGQTLMKAVPPVVQGLLEPWLTKAGPDEYVFSPAEAPNPHPNVGAQYTTEAYYTAVMRACARAQRHHVPIPAWSPNQLRHSIATLIRQGLGYDASSQYLGHKSVDTTAIYAERSRDAVLEVAARLEDTLFPRIFGNT